MKFPFLVFNSKRESNQSKPGATIAIKCDDDANAENAQNAANETKKSDPQEMPCSSSKIVQQEKLIDEIVIKGRKITIWRHLPRFTSMENEIEHKVNINDNLSPGEIVQNLNDMSDDDIVHLFHAWVEIQDFARVKQIQKSNVKEAVLLLFACIKYFGLSSESKKKNS